MATWKFKGIDEYVAKIEQLSQHSTGHLKAALYEGARVVADNMKAAINSLPTQDEFVKPTEMRQNITSEQKESLVRGFGLSDMRVDGGSVNTKAGFTGRCGNVSNSTLARQVESGTSWMRKHPVLRRAANQSKGAAEAAMAAKLDSIIKQHM